MCKNATKTAGSLLAAIEPTLQSLLTEAGVLNTPQAQAALAAYDDAVKDVESWQSGTPAQNAIEAVQDFQTAFNAVAALTPLAPYVPLVNLVLGGVEAVIGILDANQPVAASATAQAAIASEPAVVAGTPVAATEEESQAIHQANVMATTTAKIKVLVPSFQRAKFMSPAHQYVKAYNKASEALNATPAPTPSTTAAA